MCRKISYGYRSAHETLGLIRRFGNRKKLPRRAYYCIKCKQWHLTKMEVTEWQKQR